MRQPAPDVHLLGGLPPYAINVYLVGDVLIDAGSRHARRRILRQLRGHTVSAHALTHAHADHQGSSHAVCDALGIPLWCGELDVAAAEDGRIRERMPDHPINDLIARVFPGPGHPVARAAARGRRGRRLPGPQPRVGAPPGRARARPRVLRSRATAARPGQARCIHRRAPPGMTLTGSVGAPGIL